ncbi:VOC family protein [Lacticaseibacillus baoqingensis]|uniref:VOC family protein n=1 Tax=Lacticaseibacillus baoqingensis TaxID=2486013 RepID=A0ABW4E5A4_9LACO|nr:VOC family protein [Lacticaseibacillus baoqingensis]
MIETQGLHHITVTTSAPQAFFTLMTKTLGLHLRQQTVNLDDPSSEHLIFTADLAATAAALTVFCQPGQTPAYRGTNLLTPISLAVASADALPFWQTRLDAQGLAVEMVQHRFGHAGFTFTTRQGLRFQLVCPPAAPSAMIPTTPTASTIPAAFRIIGLGPLTIRALNPAPLITLMTQVLPYHHHQITGNWHQFQDPAGHLVWVEQRSDLPLTIPGTDMGHHAAFAVADESSLPAAAAAFSAHGWAHSAILDRNGFKSIYFRVTPRMRFELATRTHWPTRATGLTLPASLEPRRAEITAQLPLSLEGWS